jgi:hypothetical protein
MLPMINLLTVQQIFTSDIPIDSVRQFEDDENLKST